MHYFRMPMLIERNVNHGPKCKQSIHFGLNLHLELAMVVIILKDAGTIAGIIIDQFKVREVVQPLEVIIGKDNGKHVFMIFRSNLFSIILYFTLFKQFLLVSRLLILLIDNVGEFII